MPQIYSNGSPSTNCTTRLRILDSLGKGTEVLIGSYCDGEIPRMCDHKALQNDTRSLRACSMSESYVSAGSGLVLEQAFGPVSQQLFTKLCKLDQTQVQCAIVGMLEVLLYVSYTVFNATEPNLTQIQSIWAPLDLYLDK